MTDYMTSGGVFMIPLAILLLIVLFLSGKAIAQTFSGTGQPSSIKKVGNLVLQIGAFSFFLGILSQIMGLMQAFQMIQQAGTVSPAMIAGGLYVSFIAPSFGLIILLLSLLVWSAVTYKAAH